jgi:hypothetical protein
VNNITYVNQRVNNAVTVVSHDAFVNARPVAQNVMRVDPKEIAAAPVSHVVAAEPLRTSVVGAGRPVTKTPPAAVLNRPVVAVRTPPPPPHPIEQRQAQAGGHLNQQLLVRPMAAARPAPAAQPSQPGFKSFGQPNGGTNNNAGANNQVKPMLKPQPRVYEQQGASQENENRGVQQFGTPRPEAQPAQQQKSAPQNREFTSPSQESHPLVKPAPPVQERTPQQEQQQEQKFNQWQQQKPAPPAPKPQSKPAPAPKQSPPPKNH